MDNPNVGWARSHAGVTLWQACLWDVLVAGPPATSPSSAATAKEWGWRGESEEEPTVSEQDEDWGPMVSEKPGKTDGARQDEDRGQGHGPLAAAGHLGENGACVLGNET